MMKKGRGKTCKFVFLIITVKQNPYNHNIYDRKSYNTRQNVGGGGVGVGAMAETPTTKK